VTCGATPRADRPTTREGIVADLTERQRTLTGALHALPQPTIAALPGAAAGAGFSLALSCDLRIAAESAFVTTSYARLGLSGDYGGSWFLTQLVGTAKARELLFTAARVDAAGIGAEPASCASVAGVRKLVAAGVIDLRRLVELPVNVFIHRGLGGGRRRRRCHCQDQQGS